ncbi:protein translocase subunit SecF [Nocardioides insulae]|uniref:protein translocase subunit SecF n=1 Tax=Nocardioides insulae TaxID=394734 RepID=UPI000410027F|nr:protein translocase subunit SecF [Nocardioides insulae]
MGKLSQTGHDLYTGRRSIDFVGHRALWYTISGLLVVACLLVIFIKGLNFGIEFTGGTQYRLSDLTSSQATQETADELRDAVGESGIPGTENPNVTTTGDDGLIIQVEDLTLAQSAQLTNVVTDIVPVEPDQVSQDEIGASWGREVAERALIGVAVFLVLVALFIGIYFREWKMSVAALVALFHDVVITIGVYSLSGFSVTPAAVTGVLAILGFSLYDTVVVFDKIRENTAEMRKTKLSYAQSANLAVNQTLVRSINTSIVALIPLAAILYVSAIMLGASSLKDLALAQFVGMAAGIFSSVLIAPRLLVHLKSNETEVVQAERRAKAAARRAVDPYADVPAAHADDTPATARADRDEDLAVEVEYEEERSPRTPPAAGRGRIAPPAHGPVEESGAAGRPQPSRKPRSKRGK